MSLLFMCYEHFRHGSAQMEMCINNLTQDGVLQGGQDWGKCDTFKCQMCGEEMSKANKSRHIGLHERNEH